MLYQTLAFISRRFIIRLHSSFHINLINNMRKYLLHVLIMRASMKKYILLFILTWSAVTLLPQITHGMWGFGEKSTEETKASRGIKLVDKGGTDTDRRIALVIGNGSYKSSPLRNPVNDAVDVASKLKRLGFNVTDGKDMTRKEMYNAIREFGDNLKKGGVGNS